MKSSSRARRALGAHASAHLRFGHAAGSPAPSADETSAATDAGATGQHAVGAGVDETVDLPGDGMPSEKPAPDAGSAAGSAPAAPPAPSPRPSLAQPASASPSAAPESPTPPSQLPPSPSGDPLPPTDAVPPAGLLGPPPAARFTPDGLPKLTRRPEGSILGGVCGGIADHLRVPVLWVRVTFALLAVMAGAGVLAYALLWIFVPQRTPSPAQAAGPASAIERRQALGVAAVGVALLIVATALGFGQVLTWVLGPLGLAAIGAAFIWREADEGRRARWRRTAAGIVGPTTGSWWRLIGGCLLVVGGLSVFAIGQLDFTAVRSALIAVVLTLVGVAVITIPWWLRLVRDLGDERRGRIQERERAEIAAHLHDSVLQTLALIQRQAGNAREVQRLARSQERQLRTWLYGPAGYAAAGESSRPASISLAASLAEVAGEIEDTYAVAVTPVIVGDATMDQHLAALVAAAREAMVNAAKHAGVEEISVYAEVEDGVASVFVRDRGVGFDQKDVATDRRGLAESIRGRMERHGGKATVRSTLGEGTEVELTVQVSTAADDTDRTGFDGPFEPAGAGSDTRPAGSNTGAAGSDSGSAGSTTGPFESDNGPVGSNTGPGAQPSTVRASAEARGPA
ncbi:PspC domain-containing protein [Nakamurella sp. GG22]